MLKLNTSVYRFLISTTSRLFGEYHSEDLLISHAWQVDPPIEKSMENSFSRSYYMISVNFPNPKDSYDGGGGKIHPNLLINHLLIYLSVLYGKRFDYHGPVEEFGLFRVPSLASNEPTKHPKIGFNNHKPRSNFNIDLNLFHFKLMRPLFTGGEMVNQRVRDIFVAAGSFYLQALQRYGTHPESAYLDLITCGEILSNYYSYSDEQIYDKELLQQFSAIESQIERGDAIVRNIKKRLYQVSRRFSMTIVDLLTPDFCEKSEVLENEQYAALEWEMLGKRIAAAYQVRSSYVHTGKRFAKYIQAESEERQIGKFVVDAKESKEVKQFFKALNEAPTFKGLERIIRYCLLRFLETSGSMTFSLGPEDLATPV